MHQYKIGDDVEFFLMDGTAKGKIFHIEDDFFNGKQYHIAVTGDKYTTVMFPRQKIYCPLISEEEFYYCVRYYNQLVNYNETTY